MSDEHNSAFGPIETRRAPCPECKRDVRVETLFQRKDRGSVGPDFDWVIESYVFQCRGCEITFFARSTGNSEDYFDFDTGKEEREYIDEKSFLPAAPSVPTPSWAGFKLAKADETLHDLVRSIYFAMNNDMAVLAAIGMRTAFDRISELLEVSTELSFANKLESLRTQGNISGVQKGILEVLIDAGSAAAHRGWKPDQNHLETMLEILEALIRDQFILKPEVEGLRAKIPKK